MLQYINKEDILAFKKNIIIISFKNLKTLIIF